MEGEGDAWVERARRVDSGERWELTAFITAFSPCHGFSLRHSLQAIERQAICLPFALSALYTSPWSACMNFLRLHPIGLLVTLSLNRYRVVEKWDSWSFNNNNNINNSNYILFYIIIYDYCLIEFFFSFVYYYFFFYYRTLYESIKIVSVQTLQRTYTVNIWFTKGSSVICYIATRKFHVFNSRQAM